MRRTTMPRAPSLQRPRMRRRALAILSILTLAAAAKHSSRLPSEGSVSHGLHGRAYESSRRRRFGSRGDHSRFSYDQFNHSRQNEPDLPQYAWEEVTTNEPRVRHQDRRFGQFPDTEPQISEPEDDVDKVWSQHDSHEDGVEEDEEDDRSHEEKLAHSPIVYQYFGRNRSRVHTADSIPFILLGPTVDHWKIVGQTLASRGFSVMACEISNDKDTRGNNLIVSILDALRWNRAILVGCDSEATTAIEAAMQLAPERIAGLVLCGDLTSANRLARRSLDTPVSSDMDALDALLEQNLACPFTIVWDGDVAQAPHLPADTFNTADMFSFNRCLLLGCGTAPHRRVPEQFAWALTRFVEEKVAPRSVPLGIPASNTSVPRPSRVQEIFSPGSLLVAGRIVASVIFYVTAIKVAVYQYDSVRDGVIGIQSLLQYLKSCRQGMVAGVGGFVRNYGYVSSLFRGRSTNTTALAIVDAEDSNDSAGNTTVEAEEDKVDENGHDDTEEEKDSDDDESETQEGEEEEREEPRRLILLDHVVV